jgi:hypothetical protein
MLVRSLSAALAAAERTMRRWHQPVRTRSQPKRASPAHSRCTRDRRRQINSSCGSWSYRRYLPPH